MVRNVNYLAIIVFALAAMAQYNDVHALRWILVYGAATVLSVLFALKRLHWATASVLAAVCLIWALFKVPYLTIGGFQHIMEEVSMIHPGVEDAREFLGLLIISAWVTVLAVSSYRKKKK